MAAVLSSTPPAGSVTARRSRTVIIGRVITGIGAVLMALDTGIKLSGAKEAIEGTVQLGFPAAMVLPLGVIQLVCLILYIVPRTAPVGAVLLTAYLGGAVATHVRLGNPMFTHILSPVYLAIILWLGLYLSDPRVRAAVAPVRA